MTAADGDRTVSGDPKRGELVAPTAPVFMVSWIWPAWKTPETALYKSLRGAKERAAVERRHGAQAIVTQFNAYRVVDQ